MTKERDGVGWKKRDERYEGGMKEERGRMMEKEGK